LANIQQPNEVLGLSTYTTGTPNISLKIREAWLPKLDINISYPSLARLPLWCIDVAACALNFLKENSKYGVINEGKPSNKSNPLSFLSIYGQEAKPSYNRHKNLRKR